MSLSEAKRSAIYKAVADAVTDVRIKFQKMKSTRHTSYAGGTLPADTVDAELFYLEQRAGEAAIRAAEASTRRQKKETR